MLVFTDEGTSVLARDKGKHELLLQFIFMCTFFCVPVWDYVARILYSMHTLFYLCMVFSYQFITQIYYKFNNFTFDSCGPLQSPPLSELTNSPAYTCVFLAMFLGSPSFLNLGQWLDECLLDSGEYRMQSFWVKICEAVHACFSVHGGNHYFTPGLEPNWFLVTVHR